MNHIGRILMTLLLFGMMTQCRKEPSYNGNPDPAPNAFIPAAEPITANIQGNVLDENDLPASGVNISIGSNTTMTNDAGYFRINQAGLDKKNTMVVATKAGYFTGIRLFAANAGTNMIRIKLIRKNLAGTVDAAAGGTVSLSGGGQVLLQPNAVYKVAGGSDYTGQINVYAAYIDPSLSDIDQTVPGSFAAIDKNGKMVVMTSFGMMAVELESAAGEKLQLRSGKPATLTTPIPSAALSSAPATIPLWYVDESIGLWREEGTATKQGDKYVGEVSHFSFWNCDFGNTAIYLSMTILNASGQPMVNTAVRVTRPSASWLTTATGYTDSLGHVTGIVPASENLRVEVLDACGNAAFTQNVAPLTQSTDLGNISLLSTTEGTVTIRGKLLSCNNTPVTNGYAIIYFDNSVRYAATDASGNYEASFMYCPASPSTATIVSIDNGNGPQQMSTTLVNITSPLTNLADIVTCGATSFGYLNYNIDGTNYYFDEGNTFNFFGLYTPGQETAFQADNQGLPGPSRLFTMWVGGSSAGTFPVTSIGCTEMNAPGGPSIVYLPGASCTFTRFATMWPDYFEGSFTVQYYYSTSPAVIHSINGNFRIKHRF